MVWFAGKSSIYIVPGFLSGLPRLTTKSTSRLPDVSQCRLVPKSTLFRGYIGLYCCISIFHLRLAGNFRAIRDTICWSPGFYVNSEVPKSLENFAGVIAEERGVVMTHRSSVDEADGVTVTADVRCGVGLEHWNSRGKGILFG